MMITTIVVGKAAAQYAHCPRSMSRTSLEFIPKIELMVLSGKKIMVTMVKA